MRLVVLAAGRLRERYAKLGTELYATRLEKMVPFEIVEVPEPKGADADETGVRLAERLRDEDHVVLLAADGRQYGSEEFASLVKRALVGGRGRCVFVVGGPYGAGEAAGRRADERLSLGKLTLPHELARVVLLEQLYRAVMILRGRPYHHGGAR